ncbi:hypothetical protein BGV40_02580 [Methanosarcina sp. Ant1]|nr:hypothetical protein BGV40_02580 [Methanosarcina sp. Ant1]
MILKNWKRQEIEVSMAFCSSKPNLLPISKYIFLKNSNDQERNGFWDQRWISSTCKRNPTKEESQLGWDV